MIGGAWRHKYFYPTQHSLGLESHAFGAQVEELFANLAAKLNSKYSYKVFIHGGVNCILFANLAEKFEFCARIPLLF